MCSINADQSWEIVFWNAFFFLLVFLCGYLGMMIGIKLSRKYLITPSEFHAGRFVIVAVLIFLVAGIGQLLFVIDKQTEEISSVTKTTYKEADVVLLLDASDSMNESNYVEARTKAATVFVESLDANIHLQVVSFADKADTSRSDLLTMDEDGKTEVIEYIESIPTNGITTNFTKALAAALDILDNSEDTDRTQIVIMVTDGESGISADMQEEFLDSECILFSIRTTYDTDNILGRSLASYAKKTGGTDVVVELDANGNMDASELTAAFEETISMVSEETSVETITKLSLGKDFLLGSEETKPYQFIIRFLTLFLCVVLFEIGYFGRFSFSKLLHSLILAAVLSLLITILSAMLAGAALMVLCLGTSYVTLRVQDASQHP